MAGDGPTAGEFLLGVCVIDRQNEDPHAAAVDDVRTPGTAGLLAARETPDGLELVDEHKRTWVASQAYPDTAAGSVRHPDDEAAAEEPARTHDQDLDDLRPHVQD